MYLSSKCSTLQAITTKHFVVVTCLAGQHCMRWRNPRLNALFCICHVASCCIVKSYVGEHLRVGQPISISQLHLWMKVGRGTWVKDTRTTTIFSEGGMLSALFNTKTNIV